MIFSALLVAATAQATLPPPETGIDPDAMAARIAEAHGAETYYAQPAIKADVRVEFDGNVVHDGVMWFSPSAAQTRLESDDKTIVFDGEKVWVSPPDQLDGRERFTALTWPYFLAVPFKLHDGGVNLQDAGHQPIKDTPQPAMKMTFEPGTGDAPDDWYIIWADNDGRLEALAYIVTYFPDRGEPEPHVVLYENDHVVDDVVFPKTLTFYNWSTADGLFGEPIGNIEVRSIEFAEPPEGTFTKPDGAAEAPLPDKSPQAE